MTNIQALKSSAWFNLLIMLGTIPWVQSDRGLGVHILIASVALACLIYIYDTERMIRHQEKGELVKHPIPVAVGESIIVCGNVFVCTHVASHLNKPATIEFKQPIELVMEKEKNECL